MSAPYRWTTTASFTTDRNRGDRSARLRSLMAPARAAPARAAPAVRPLSERHYVPSGRAVRRSDLPLPAIRPDPSRGAGGLSGDDDERGARKTRPRWRKARRLTVVAGAAPHPAGTERHLPAPVRAARRSR